VEPERCTLIVTEGDSAKALAMSGLSVVGREHFGVFALRGKPMNVREATAWYVDPAHADKDKGNKELSHLAWALGLDPRMTEADAVRRLKYHHLLIMADQVSAHTHCLSFSVACICCRQLFPLCHVLTRHPVRTTTARTSRAC
jgi:DNA topoisomerase-2